MPTNTAKKLALSNQRIETKASGQVYRFSTGMSMETENTSGNVHDEILHITPSSDLLIGGS